MNMNQNQSDVTRKAWHQLKQISVIACREAERMSEQLGRHVSLNAAVLAGAQRGDDWAVHFINATCMFVLSCASDATGSPVVKDALTAIVVALRDSGQFPKEQPEPEWFDRFGDLMTRIQKGCGDLVPEPSSVVAVLNEELGSSMELPEGFEYPASVRAASDPESRSLWN